MTIATAIFAVGLLLEGSDGASAQEPFCNEVLFLPSSDVLRCIESPLLGEATAFTSEDGSEVRVNLTLGEFANGVLKDRQGAALPGCDIVDRSPDGVAEGSGFVPECANAFLLQLVVR